MSSGSDHMFGSSKVKVGGTLNSMQVAFDYYNNVNDKT